MTPGVQTDRGSDTTSDTGEVRSGIVGELPVVRHLAPIRRFLFTRSRVLAGEDLHDLSDAERNERGLLSPWRFNVAETVIAALPAQGLLSIADFLKPEAPPVSGDPFADAVGQTFGSMLNYALTLTAPLTGLVLAWVAGRYSLWPEDRSPLRMRRARNAFLYYEAAHYLWFEAAWALVLTFSSVAPRFEALQSWVPSLNTIIRLGFYASITLDKNVRESLFLTNGYFSAESLGSAFVPERIISLRESLEQSTREAPTRRYKWAMRLLAAPAILMGVVLLFIGSFGAAFAVTSLQFWLQGLVN